MIFTSFPVILDLFGGVVQATLNSRTGRSFSGGRSFDFGFGDGFPEIVLGEGTQKCAQCFNCKVPVR